MSRTLTAPACGFFDVIDADSVSIPERKGIEEYLEGAMVMSLRFASAAGPYYIAQTPHVREVYRAFQGREFWRISMCWASQMAKSTCTIGTLAYGMAQCPAPAMWVFPSEKALNSFVTERLKPAFEASPAMLGLLRNHRNAMTNAKFDFVQAPLYMALADSEADLASKPIGHLYLDEIDKYPASTANEGSPIRQAISRTRWFPDRKVIENSTPTRYDGAIWASMADSTKHEWAVEDPGSGALVMWDFENLRWAERPSGIPHKEWARGIKMGDVEVWYQFPSGARIRTRGEKNALNRNGRYIVTSKGAPDHAGFHVNSMAGMMTDLRELAAAMVNAHGKMAAGDHRDWQHFTIHEKARPFQLKGAMHGEDELQEMCSDVPRGVMPRGYSHPCIFVDVQHESVWWMAMCFDFTRGALHVMDWGQVHDSLETVVETLRARVWKGPEISGCARILGVDSGDGTMTGRVYACCNHYSGLSVLPFHGLDTENTQGRYYRHVREVKDARLDHKGKLIITAVNLIKDYVHAKWQGKLLTFFANAAGDKIFAHQMVSEERTTKKDKRGKNHTIWASRPGYDDNHLWDCCVGATAGGIICGLIRNDPIGDTARKKPGRFTVSHNSTY